MRLATRAANDPFTELDRLFDDLRARFYGPGGVWFAPDGPVAFGLVQPGPAGLRAPAADVTDTGAGYRIVAELPGIPKEKLEVRIHGALVEIEAQVAAEAEPKDGSVVYRERTERGFYRAVELPEPIVATEATAKLVDGVLTVEVPKEKPAPPAGEVKVPVA
ncbi:MAG TPA: Hsp20/alpha crystallin family protein [Thermoplasmata archaeon]|nr:Hsp20/alpha crystallin family protein [Thermoplasmata archaeon]HUJ78262.1 Hsp20/alpha crystallin family protein [Thermoplasmata archaeon]